MCSRRCLSLTIKFTALSNFLVGVIQRSIWRFIVVLPACLTSDFSCNIECQCRLTYQKKLLHHRHKHILKIINKE